MSAEERVVFWNGKFIPEKEARISIYDSAFMFGDTIFEMTRTFNKKQFMLMEHVERLVRSAKFVRMNIPYTVAELMDIVEEVMRRNEPTMKEDDEHRTMIDITRGLLGIYKETGNADETNVIISDFPLRWTIKHMAKYYKQGVDLVVPSQRAIPSRYLNPKIKCRSRLHFLKANQEASAVGKDCLPLLLDEHGFVTEGSGYNFFMMDNDGYIFTPKTDNILVGISRNYVLDILEDMTQTDFPMEKDIDVYDVENAQEAFITATPFCVLPVRSINGVVLPKRGNRLSTAILNRWSNQVDLDIVKQAESWGVDEEEFIGISPYRFEGVEE